MRVAISLAHRNLGRTSPNPSVGCVLVKDEQLIGMGSTAPKGRPHAETEALQSVSALAHGATAYVTLEPCAHTGETPPCAQALIDAGIARVVIACSDPDARVNGKGIAMLQEAGIAVTTGICENEARETLRGFFSRLEQKRPFIALKLATSLDGKIATSSGESQWITGDAARAYGHKLRAQYEAIATGSGTYLADSPALTCRLNGLEDASPTRILFDRQKRCAPPSDWLHLHSDMPLEAQLESLAEKGISSILLEAGAMLSATFLRAGLVDRLYWFHAPLVIGADGLSAPAELQQPNLAEIPRFSCLDRLQLGADSLTILEKKA